MAPDDFARYVASAELTEREWARHNSRELSSQISGCTHSRIKRCIDIAVSLIIILLGSPFLLCIALLVGLESRGPIIFSQKRHGLNGVVFTLYKFRTMQGGETSQQARKSDPRVTKVGRFLRRSSLDELPQMFNVLVGHMSLVGPRPHPLWLNERFACKIPHYRERHRVKPGLTGLAQVRGCRGETQTIQTMARRVECDLEYIAKWSLILDFKILVRTAVHAWFDEHAI